LKHVKFGEKSLTRVARQG